jgi:hypothetical protein
MSEAVEVPTESLDMRAARQRRWQTTHVAFLGGGAVGFLYASFRLSGWVLVASGVCFVLGGLAGSLGGGVYWMLLDERTVEKLPTDQRQKARLRERTGRLLCLPIIASGLLLCGLGAWMLLRAHP